VLPPFIIDQIRRRGAGQPATRRAPAYARGSFHSAPQPVRWCGSRRRRRARSWCVDHRPRL